MAFRELYALSGGSNLNSGMDTATTASLTYTGGNFVQSTGVFTVASGNPSSDGILVGDIVSLYNTGDTIARAIAAVTARDATTVTVSTTDKFGTLPTDNTGSRALKRGGAWAETFLDTAAANGFLNSANTAAVPTRVNMLKTTTFTTAAARTLGFIGATLTPLLFEGYSSTPGDLRTPPTTARVGGTDIPLWSVANIVSFGAFTSLANAAVSGTVSNALIAGGGSAVFGRVQFNNASNNSAARALTCAATKATIDSCRLQVGGTTAASCLSISSGSADVLNSVIIGGDIGISGGLLSVVGCKVINYGTTGIQTSTTGNYIGFNTISGGTNCVRVIGTPGAPFLFDGNLFANATNGINYDNSAAVTSLLRRRFNAYWTVTNPSVNLLAETYGPIGEVTLGVDPFVNAAGGNYTLTPTSLAVGVAAPGVYEGETYQSYPSMGAYQPAPSGVGGGGGPLIGGRLVKT